MRCDRRELLRQHVLRHGRPVLRHARLDLGALVCWTSPWHSQNFESYNCKASGFTTEYYVNSNYCFFRLMTGRIDHITLFAPTPSARALYVTFPVSATVGGNHI